MVMAPAPVMSIGEMAKRTGCTVQTIRYYEGIGLMGSPTRTGGGHRAYRDAELKRLHFVCHARDLGFAIKEIKGMLVMMEDKTLSCSEMAQRAENHLEGVRSRLIGLQNLETTLSGVLSQCHREDRPECAIIDALQDGYAEDKTA